tara:strand:+ start:213 stop:530 length:318 start_codon:yes stop_codon:yes gene_type:complete
MTMKAIKLNGETYSKLAPFIDAFGEAMAAGKGAEKIKDDIRHIFDIGNHKGETFTLAIKKGKYFTRMDSDKLEKLARRLGATDRQIKNCNTSGLRANTVGVSVNK